MKDITNHTFYKYLKRKLENCKNFQDFFNKVSQYRLELENEELKYLIKLIDEFREKYGVETICFLKDSLQLEYVWCSKLK